MGSSKKKDGTSKGEVRGNEDSEEVRAALNAQLQDAMEVEPEQDDRDGQASSSSGSSRAHSQHEESEIGEQSNDSGSDSDDAEDDDEEPTLRYSRIQSSPLSDLFSRGDTCSSLACSDKYLVLGTHNGGVFILARPGQSTPSAATATATTAEKGKGKAKQTDLDSKAEEDLEGQTVVKRYRPHQASVMDLVIDEESQFVASASTDGKVVILNIASSDAQLFDLGRPLRCIALEPSYATKSTRQFVSGGLSGNLTLHEKGWLGPKDVVLHSGEGPIWAVQWRRNYIAWSNDRGIRIYDTHTSTRIAFIPRNEESPRSDLFPPTLLWQSDTRLVTSQADFIKVIDIRDRRQQERDRIERERLKAEAEKEKDNGSVKSDKTGSGYNPLAGMGAYVPSIPGVSSSSSTATSSLPPIYAEVTNVLQLDCMISGIIPFLSTAPDASALPSSSTTSFQDTYSTTPNFLVLSYTTEDTFSDEASPTESKPSLPPELRIISIDTGEELSSDVLSVQGYEKFGCKDYKIVGHFPSIKAPTASTSLVNTQNANGNATPPATPRRSSKLSNTRHLKPAKTESYFVISPRDLVLVKKRDVADHIAWLCERHRYEDALAVIERKGLSTSVLSGFSKGEGEKLDVEDIGQKFLQHLLDGGEWEKAARNLGKILQQDQKKWEDWIFTFVQKGHMQTVIPYVPTQEPQLGRMVYEMILAHFLKTDPPTLLQTIKTWPPAIYDAPAVINAIRSEYEREASSSKTSPSINILMESLVELHLMNKQPGKAVPYYLRLRKAGVFDLIREYSLFTDIQDQAMLLVDFDQDMRRRREKGKESAGVRSDRIDESKHGEAIQLLVDHTHSIPIPRVVAQLRSNRHFLYMYLDTLFTSDPTAAYEYSDLLVDLYAEYDYPRLLDFLRASTTYSLEKAYEICKTRDYVPEMVFLLGRMGNNKQALELIIERLGDVQRAIDFAKEQNDHDLWEDLLKYSETRPNFIRGLLENVGPEIDPIRLIRRIKNGLQIPGLKRALIKILQDFNIQISLIEGCKTILNTDGRYLSLELHDGQTNAFVASVDNTVCYKCSKAAFVPPQPSSSTSASATSAEAISIVFLCRHIFHISCALPDMDLPSRPQHFLNPLLADLGGNEGAGNDLGTGRTDRDRAIAAKILFASQLKARAKTQVRCPACVGGKSRLQVT